jgi:hypothetical protein
MISIFVVCIVYLSVRSLCVIGDCPFVATRSNAVMPIMQMHNSHADLQQPFTTALNIYDK